MGKHSNIILVDENGMIVAYYICDRYPNQISYDGKTTWTRVEAYSKATGLPNILHIMESERTDQYRGVPYLAGVIEPLLQLRRYTESELMAANGGGTPSLVVYSFLASAAASVIASFAGCTGDRQKHLIAANVIIRPNRYHTHNQHPSPDKTRSSYEHPD